MKEPVRPAHPSRWLALLRPSISVRQVGCICRWLGLASKSLVTGKYPPQLRHGGGGGGGGV